MRFGDRSDAELIELAQAGWAPAFAVLVHRHAPTVRAARADASAPLPAVTSVFLRAMRELRERDPRSAVAPWLLGLAGARTTPPPTPVPLTPDELDAVWSELHAHWPDGSRPPRRVPWQRAVAVVGLAALAGLLPAVVLGIDGTASLEDPVELRAVPLPDERTEAVEETEEDEEPDFSFPVTPEEQEAEPAPPPQPQPTEPAASETEPEEPDEPAVDEPSEEAGEPDDGVEGDDGAEDESCLPLLPCPDEEEESPESAPDDPDGTDDTDDTDDTESTDGTDDTNEAATDEAGDA